MESKVSVSMVTYNHEKYISQAIESVLAQKVNFPVELIIGEDFSTDGTREICLSYQKKYPDIIKLHLADKNRGSMLNFIQNIEACKSKYVAVLDGDDYWTDPLKLQKQVDFLEANPGFVLCFHNVRIDNTAGETSYAMNNTQAQKDVYDFEDACSGKFIAHISSWVYRNGLFSKLPPMIYESGVGDWPLLLLISEHGKIKYLNEVMSVYNIRTSGFWLSNFQKSDWALNKLRHLNLFDKHYNHKYHAHLFPGNSEAALHHSIIIEARKSRNYYVAWFYTLKLIILKVLKST